MGGPKMPYGYIRIPGSGLDGLTGWRWKDMKKNYGIIPVFVTCALGLSLGVAHILRLAIKSTDTNINNNPEPWEAYRHKQYKYLGTGRDFSKPNPAPIYRDMSKFPYRIPTGHDLVVPPQDKEE